MSPAWLLAPEPPRPLRLRWQGSAGGSGGDLHPARIRLLRPASSVIALSRPLAFSSPSPCLALSPSLFACVLTFDFPGCLSHTASGQLWSFAHGTRHQDGLLSPIPPHPAARGTFQRAQPARPAASARICLLTQPPRTVISLCYEPPDRSFPDHPLAAAQ